MQIINCTSQQDTETAYNIVRIYDDIRIGHLDLDRETEVL